jgi:hypothetical protein
VSRFPFLHLLLTGASYAPLWRTQVPAATGQKENPAGETAGLAPNPGQIIEERMITEPVTRNNRSAPPPSTKSAPAPKLSLTPVDPLDAWLYRGQKEVFTVTTVVTPEMAARLLERNLDNRTIRWKGPARTVEAYAAAMSRGEWDLNGEAVVMSREGLMNDGQHRCEAVVLSGVSPVMQITFGVARESRHTLDQGAGRTPGDILALSGEKNTHQLAHAIQFVWAYDGQRVFGYRPSPKQLQETLEANPELREAITSVRPLVNEFKGSSGYLAGAHYVCARVDRAAAERFLNGVATGLDIHERGSPVFRFRKRLQDHLARREVITAVEQAALYIKAFNLVRRGRNVGNLLWRRNGDAAEDFPVAGV